jgi:hypothetical protein
MKVTPLHDRLLVTGSDDKEHAIVRRSLLLAGGVLRHAPACPFCGSGEGPRCSAQWNSASADGTTIATVLAQAIFRERVPPVKAEVDPAEIKRGIRPRHGNRRGIHEEAVPVGGRQGHRPGRRAPITP